MKKTQPDMQFTGLLILGANTDRTLTVEVIANMDADGNVETHMYAPDGTPPVMISTLLGLIASGMLEEPVTTPIG